MTALLLLRRIWPALAALAVLAALWAWGNSRYRAGRDSRKPEIAALKADLKTATDNQAKLWSAIADQNAAIEALAKAGETARKTALEAREKAAKEARGNAALKARLDAVARAGGKACPVVPVAREAWGKLQ